MSFDRLSNFLTGKARDRGAWSIQMPEIRKWFTMCCFDHLSDLTTQVIFIPTKKFAGVSEHSNIHILPVHGFCSRSLANPSANSYAHCITNVWLTI
ncbi:hypothetical protein JB92DRAFT_1957214 [Gautieria morchelliformis]|nr:hypothetical protein JB92DRAFT_1957214 [Gautieria morchelliformis]